MTASSSDLIQFQQRGNLIRLRTMIWLRWAAIAGQIIALLVAQQLYSLRLEVGLCYLAVGVSVVGNLVAMFVFPENKRLTERENLFMFMFDLLQLGLLLYLTGGLHNPFSMLIVGPVTVSAAALSLRSTVFLGITAILLVSLLAEFHLQLRTEQGFILRIPNVFVFGNWVAIVIAVIFLGVYSRWVSSEAHSMSTALQATQMALAREQKLTDLGGVVAAAAHELGTPLATIKLASSELADELEAYPDLAEDARLINEQADRCRDIMRSMGRAGKDDLQMHQAPLAAVLRDAAEPHLERGKTVHFDDGALQGVGDAHPSIRRQPELIHGIRNLVQNAVDFARANVWVDAEWTDETITVRIQDDGRGYPPHMIGRIGNPFMRARKSAKDRAQRPEYEGMGLGLFIAKTLLERTGAELSFANGFDAHASRKLQTERCGAVVEVVWPREKIDPSLNGGTTALGENKPIEI